MEPNSTLRNLSQNLERSKRIELEKIKEIENEKFKELAESLRESYRVELNTIEEDMIARLGMLQKKMREARQEIVKDEKATLILLRENTIKIKRQTLNLYQTLNKVKMRYWITPIIVGISLTIGLSAGVWGLGLIISERNQTLNQLNDTVIQAKKIKDKYIMKAWKNGIGVKRKPNVWKDQETDLWIIQFEKGK